MKGPACADAQEMGSKGKQLGLGGLGQGFVPQTW